MILNKSNTVFKSERSFTFLLRCFALLFLSLHFFSAFVQQAGPDEMNQIYLMQKFGFFASMKHVISFYNVRWPALMISNGFLFFMQTPTTYRIGSLLFYVLLFCTFCLSINTTFAFFKIERKYLFLNACVFYAAYFFFTTSTIEIFGWLSGSITYLMPIAVSGFLFAIYFKNSLTLWQWVGIVLAAMIIGGCAENYYVFISLALIVTYFMFYYKYAQLRFFVLKRLIVYLVFGLLGFLPGKSVLGIENKIYVLKQLPFDFAKKSSFAPDSFFLSDFDFVEPRMFFAILLLLIPAWQINKYISISKRWMLVFSTFLTIMVLLNLFASFLLFGNLGSGRFWSPVYFFILLFLFTILLWFLGKQKDDKDILMNAKTATTLCCSVLLFAYTIRRFPSLLRYYNHVELLSTRIMDRKKNFPNDHNALYVNPFPPPGIIVENVITSDSAHFFNVCLQRYYGVKFPIVLGSNKNVSHDQ
jgi:hypothetical protein